MIANGNGRNLNQQVIQNGESIQAQTFGHEVEQLLTEGGIIHGEASRNVDNMTGQSEP